jgi:hypothetical protein
MTDLTKYRQYSEIAEQLIKIADKEQLAECARLLAMNVAHYEMKYGALLLEEILATTQSGTPNDQQAELMAKGTETLVGMLGNVMQGFDKQVSH